MRARRGALSRTFDPNPGFPGFKVEIKDLNTNIKTIYKSIREAARSLNSHMS